MELVDIVAACFRLHGFGLRIRAVRYQEAQFAFFIDRKENIVVGRIVSSAEIFGFTPMLSIPTGSEDVESSETGMAIGRKVEFIVQIKWSLFISGRIDFRAEIDRLRVGLVIDAIRIVDIESTKTPWHV